MATKQQVATRDTAPEPVRDPTLAAWEEATAEAAVLVSYDVAKDEYLDALVGVDMVITGVTYRPGMEGRSYVSLEIMLSPDWDLRRINLARSASGMPRLESLDDIPWEPGEHVVVNSGSTGIYRQVTEILWRTDAIALPEPVVEAGKRGECSFDLPPSGWADTAEGTVLFDNDGNTIYQNKDLRVRCKKGIRVSAYTSDEYGDATTYYLA